MEEIDEVLADPKEINKYTFKNFKAQMASIENDFSSSEVLRDSSIPALRYKGIINIEGTDWSLLNGSGPIYRLPVHTVPTYLNNLIEADHGKLKRLIKPTLGFKSLKTAYATIKGFEVMRMFKKGQMDLWKYGQGLKGEICLVNRQFSVYTV